MPFRPVCTVSQLGTGALTEVVIDGRSLAIANVEGQVYAMDGVCPHRNAPLGQGALHGTKVVCPWHAWEFDCRNGEHDYNPSIRLQTFAVKVEGDDILVEL